MFTVVYARKFRKKLRTLARSGVFELERFEMTVDILRQGKSLDAIFRDHQLKGKMAGYREYHLFGDLLVVYEKDESVGVVTFSDIGTHSNLFGR